MFNLKEKKVALNEENAYPKSLCIVGPPKGGKTTSITQLDKYKIEDNGEWRPVRIGVIDLENAADHFSGLIFNIKEAALKNGVTNLVALRTLIAQIIADYKKENKPYYDFLVYDTLTALEDIAKTLAVEMYKKVPIGAKWTGTDILSLPNGAGEFWLRSAFELLYKALEGLTNVGIIYTAHLKLGSINIDGEDLATKDIALRGGLKLLVLKDMEATGFGYRSKNGKEFVLSFKTTALDVAAGSRVKRLANKHITVTKSDENGNIDCFWEEIYPMLKK